MHPHAIRTTCFALEKSFLARFGMLIVEGIFLCFEVCRPGWMLFTSLLGFKHMYTHMCVNTSCKETPFAPPFVLTVTTLSYKILCMAYICCARGWDSSTRYNISMNLGIKFLYQTQDFTNSFFQDRYLKLPWCTKLTYTHYMRVSHAETKSICGFYTVKNIFFMVLRILFLNNIGLRLTTVSVG